MDQELRDLLEKNLQISEENNELLKKLYRSQKWSQFMSIMYWVLIIGITFGTYYYLQPYIETLLGTYTDLMSGIDTINQKSQSLPNMNTISDFLRGISVPK